MYTQFEQMWICQQAMDGHYPHARLPHIAAISKNLTDAMSLEIKEFSV